MNSSETLAMKPSGRRNAANRGEMMLSGVFFPVAQLPAAVQTAAAVLPLYHGVALVRPIVGGSLPPDWLAHAGVLIAYAAAGFYVALVLTRRRLLS